MCLFALHELLNYWPDLKHASFNPYILISGDMKHKKNILFMFKVLLKSHYVQVIPMNRYIFISRTQSVFV